MSFISMKNYLVLTPDGVGSTYLQRSLTVYLNLAGLDYTNTHELLNGLDLVNGGLRKNLEYGYSQTMGNIVGLLNENQANLVSRIAQYHIVRRKDSTKECDKFYKTCNTVFDTIIMCERDPFEYALSWGIRNITKKLNTYSIDEQIETHHTGKMYTVDIDFFKRKLQQYGDYTYWAKDNFNINKVVAYNNLINDHTNTLKYITDMSYDIAEDYNINFTEYSNVLYNTAKFKSTRDERFLPESQKGLNTVKLYIAIKKLVDEQKIISTIPLKMNTLSDKKSKTSNFTEVLNTYNDWASNNNQFLPLTDEQIEQCVEKENQIYEP